MLDDRLRRTHVILVDSALALSQGHLQDGDLALVRLARPNIFDRSLLIIRAPERFS
jgi:hypothetical protein